MKKEEGVREAIPCCKNDLVEVADHTSVFELGVYSMIVVAIHSGKLRSFLYTGELPRIPEKLQLVPLAEIERALDDVMELLC